MWGEVSQAAVGIAAIVIAVGTFVMSSNDRRHRDDREELKEEKETNERLTRERNEFERKYYIELADNAEVRRQLAEAERKLKGNP